MSIINISDLTFYYEGSYENIFEDVSFQIDTDWKLGLIGRNGRGKTTFLNLLMEKYEYKGHISSSVDFEYFPYSVTDKSKQTIDVVEEIYPAYEFWELCREWSYLKGADDVWFRPFDTLSNGEQTKLLLAVLFLNQKNFLLIDEPTNHLDMETREIVCNYLNRKSGFILVSHDRSFLDGCIDHVLSINKSNIEVVQGTFSTWWDNKQRQDAFEFAENEKIKKSIKRLSDSARQAGDWADNVESTKIGKKSLKYEKNIGTRSYVGEKSRRMQQRRKNLENQREQEIDKKKDLLKNIESNEQIKLIPARHYKDIIIDAVDLCINYNESPICNEISFQIKNGDCFVLEGKNGSGKSSVIKAILEKTGYKDINNKNLSISGKLEVASGLIISYVSQDTSFLKGSLSDFIEKEQINETLFKTILRKLDFSRSHFEKNIESYSEGQKKKILLAKSLCDQAHLYIWDEPLNFIDIFSRIQLEKLILEFKPTMILVEHDKKFVDQTANNTVTLYRSKLSNENL